MATEMKREGPGVRAARFAGTWMTNPEYTIDVEPTGKRIRAEFGGETVADSAAVLILREQGHLPVYYFPRDDVRLDLMVRTDHSTHCPHKGDASYWTLSAGGRRAENAVWSYESPFPQMTSIAGHVAFPWGVMDRWLEEDEEVLVHAADPRKRIDVRASGRRVQVMVGGACLADSSRAQFLFETDLPVRYYIPREDVRMDLLSPTQTRTRCPYKGEAVYWSATVDGTVHEDVVWSYPDPVETCPRIRDLMCFYNERVDDILVDGNPVPQVVTKWSRR